MKKITPDETVASSTFRFSGRLQQVIYHGIWWLLFVIYEMSMYVYSSGGLRNTGTLVLYYGINISLFYTHLEILNSTLGNNRRSYLKMLLLVMAELVIFLFIKIAADYYTTDFTKSPEDLSAVVQGMAAIDLYRCVFFVGLSSLYWTASNISGFERKTKEAEIARLQAAKDALLLETRLAKSDNALLRQQINPHLVFNALNFIHSTVYPVSEKAAETVIMLTDLLRFSTEEAGEDGKISLQSETEQIRNLIAINRIRFGTPVQTTFNITGNLAGYRIIPLVLLTLVENIFKHGNFTDSEALITLDLADEGPLRFYTRNQINTKVPYPRLKSTGLENIRIRLDYTYGNSYQLQTRELGGYFEAELILQ